MLRLAGKFICENLRYFSIDLFLLYLIKLKFVSYLE